MSERKIKNAETDKYVLFLTSEFSQWYPSAFKSDEGLTFHSAEQYMMHRKALMFGDAETAQKIMGVPDGKEGARQCKQLGREVKNFDAAVWDAYAREAVYKGNFYKFTQNAHLYDVLAATKGKELVEAADYDKIWGVGLNADDRLIQDKANWKGKNWLGETLTRLRDDLAAQNFVPSSRQDMFKFWDIPGQRTLYIPAQELAEQWIDYNEQKAAQAGKPHARPVDPIAWLRNTVMEALRYEAGRPYDMHDDPDIDPTMVSATIRGHGTVETEIRNFVELNSKALNLRPGSVRAPIYPGQRGYPTW